MFDWGREAVESESGSVSCSGKFLIASVFVVAALGLAAGGQVAAKVEENLIVLGATLSFSGMYVSEGNDTANGYRLAVERINAAGGVTVDGKTYELRIMFVDDESSPTIAKNLADRLINEDGVRFMLGPYSSDLTKAVARVTKEYEIPLVEAEGASPTLFPEPPNNNRYIFGLMSTARHYLDDLIELAAAWAREEGRQPTELTLAIAVQNDRFLIEVRKPILKAAEACGVRLVIDDRLKVVDLRPTLDKVAREQPDILVVSGHAKGAETAVRQLSETGIRVPIVAMTHCKAADIVGKFGAATEGIFCPAQWDSSMPYEDDLFGKAADFADAMREAFPEEGYIDVPYQSAAAAAAVMVWKDAFERANSFDTERLRDALAATDLKTFYGDIRFAPTGEINSKPMVLRQIQNGRFVIVPRSTTRGCE